VKTNHVCEEKLLLWFFDQKLPIEATLVHEISKKKIGPCVFTQPRPRTAGGMINSRRAGGDPNRTGAVAVNDGERFPKKAKVHSSCGTSLVYGDFLYRRRLLER
jgi:hypothetical protein